MKVTKYGTIVKWEVCSIIKAPFSHLLLNESFFQDSSFVVIVYFAFILIATLQRALLCGSDWLQTHNLPAVTAC